MDGTDDEDDGVLISTFPDRSCQSPILVRPRIAVVDALDDPKYAETLTPKLFTCVSQLKKDALGRTLRKVNAHVDSERTYGTLLTSAHELFPPWTKKKRDTRSEGISLVRTAHSRRYNEYKGLTDPRHTDTFAGEPFHDSDYFRSLKVSHKQGIALCDLLLDEALAKDPLVKRLFPRTGVSHFSWDGRDCDRNQVMDTQFLQNFLDRENIPPAALECLEMVAMRYSAMVAINHIRELMTSNVYHRHKNASRITSPDGSLTVLITGACVVIVSSLNENAFGIPAAHYYVMDEVQVTALADTSERWFNNALARYTRVMTRAPGRSHYQTLGAIERVAVDGFTKYGNEFYGILETLEETAHGAGLHSLDDPKLCAPFLESIQESLATISSESEIELGDAMSIYNIVMESCRPYQLLIPLVNPERTLNCDEIERLVAREDLSRTSDGMCELLMVEFGEIPEFVTPAVARELAAKGAVDLDPSCVDPGGMINVQRMLSSLKQSSSAGNLEAVYEHATRVPASVVGNAAIGSVIYRDNVPIAYRTGSYHAYAVATDPSPVPVGAVSDLYALYRTFGFVTTSIIEAVRKQVGYISVEKQIDPCVWIEDRGEFIKAIVLGRKSKTGEVPAMNIPSSYYFYPHLKQLIGFLTRPSATIPDNVLHLPPVWFAGLTFAAPPCPLVPTINHYTLLSDKATAPKASTMMLTACPSLAKVNNDDWELAVREAATHLASLDDDWAAISDQELDALVSAAVQQIRGDLQRGLAELARKRDRDPTASNRLVLKYLSTSKSIPELGLEASSRELDLDDLAFSVSAKEREIKVHARLFGVATLALRCYCSLGKKHTRMTVMDMFPELNMSHSDGAVTYIRQAEFVELYTLGVPWGINLDIKKWAPSWKRANSHPVFLGLNEATGVDGMYTRTYDYMDNAFVLFKSNPVDGNTVPLKELKAVNAARAIQWARRKRLRCGKTKKVTIHTIPFSHGWASHHGGLDGLCQEPWSVATAVKIRKAARSLRKVIKANVKGDDVLARGYTSTGGLSVPEFRRRFPDAIRKDAQTAYRLLRESFAESNLEIKMKQSVVFTKLSNFGKWLLYDTRVAAPSAKACEAVLMHDNALFPRFQDRVNGITSSGGFEANGEPDTLGFVMLVRALGVVSGVWYYNPMSGGPSKASWGGTCGEAISTHASMMVAGMDLTGLKDQPVIEQYISGHECTAGTAIATMVLLDHLAFFQKMKMYFRDEVPPCDPPDYETLILSPFAPNVKRPDNYILSDVKEATWRGIQDIVRGGQCEAAAIAGHSIPNHAPTVKEAMQQEGPFYPRKLAALHENIVDAHVGSLLALVSGATSTRTLMAVDSDDGRGRLKSGEDRFIRGLVSTSRRILGCTLPYVVEDASRSMHWLRTRTWLTQGSLSEERFSQLRDKIVGVDLEHPMLQFNMRKPHARMIEASRNNGGIITSVFDMSPKLGERVTDVAADTGGLVANKTELERKRNFTEGIFKAPKGDSAAQSIQALAELYMVELYRDPQFSKSIKAAYATQTDMPIEDMVTLVRQSIGSCHTHRDLSKTMKNVYRTLSYSPLHTRGAHSSDIQGMTRGLNLNIPPSAGLMIASSLASFEAAVRHPSFSPNRISMFFRYGTPYMLKEIEEPPQVAVLSTFDPLRLPLYRLFFVPASNVREIISAQRGDAAPNPIWRPRLATDGSAGLPVSKESYQVVVGNTLVGKTMHVVHTQRSSPGLALPSWTMKREIRTKDVKYIGVKALVSTLCVELVGRCSDNIINVYLGIGNIKQAACGVVTTLPPKSLQVLSNILFSPDVALDTIHAIGMTSMPVGAGTWKLPSEVGVKNFITRQMRQLLSDYTSFCKAIGHHVFFVRGPSEASNLGRNVQLIRLALLLKALSVNKVRATNIVSSVKGASEEARNDTITWSEILNMLHEHARQPLSTFSHLWRSAVVRVEDVGPIHEDLALALDPEIRATVKEGSHLELFPSGRATRVELPGDFRLCIRLEDTSMASHEVHVAETEWFGDNYRVAFRTDHMLTPRGIPMGSTKPDCISEILARCTWIRTDVCDCDADGSAGFTAYLAMLPDTKVVAYSDLAPMEGIAQSREADMIPNSLRRSNVLAKLFEPVLIGHVPTDAKQLATTSYQIRRNKRIGEPVTLFLFDAESPGVARLTDQADFMRHNCLKAKETGSADCTAIIKSFADTTDCVCTALAICRTVFKHVWGVKPMRSNPGGTEYYVVAHALRDDMNKLVGSWLRERGTLKVIDDTGVFLHHRSRIYGFVTDIRNGVPYTQDCINQSRLLNSNEAYTPDLVGVSAAAVTLGVLEGVPSLDEFTQKLREQVMGTAIARIQSSRDKVIELKETGSLLPTAATPYETLNLNTRDLATRQMNHVRCVDILLSLKRNRTSGNKVKLNSVFQELSRLAKMPVKYVQLVPQEVACDSGMTRIRRVERYFTADPDPTLFLEQFNKHLPRLVGWLFSVVVDPETPSSMLSCTFAWDGANKQHFLTHRDDVYNDPLSLSEFTAALETSLLIRGTDEYVFVEPFSGRGGTTRQVSLFGRVVIWSKRWAPPNKSNITVEGEHCTSLEELLHVTKRELCRFQRATVCVLVDPSWWQLDQLFHVGIHEVVRSLLSVDKRVVVVVSHGTDAVVKWRTSYRPLAFTREGTKMTHTVLHQGNIGVGKAPHIQLPHVSLPSKPEPKVPVQHHTRYARTLGASYAAALHDAMTTAHSMRSLASLFPPPAPHSTSRTLEQIVGFASGLVCDPVFAFEQALKLSVDTAISQQDTAKKVKSKLIQLASLLKNLHLEYSAVAFMGSKVGYALGLVRSFSGAVSKHLGRTPSTKSPVLRSAFVLAIYVASPSTHSRVRAYVFAKKKGKCSPFSADITSAISAPTERQSLSCLMRCYVSAVRRNRCKSFSLNSSRLTTGVLTTAGNPHAVTILDSGSHGGFVVEVDKSTQSWTVHTELDTYPLTPLMDTHDLKTVTSSVKTTAGNVIGSADLPGIGNTKVVFVLDTPPG